MSLVRPVMMPDGTVRDNHAITQITHAIGIETRLEVVSTSDGLTPYQQLFWFTCDTTMDEDAAYATLAAMPEFAEYVDPEREALDALIPSLTDEQAELVPAIFPEWAEDTAYAVGDRVRHGEVLYRCVQAHTSQAGWEPDKTPALWTRTTPEGVIPEWVQPTGAQDAYSVGDRVTHNGKTWISLVDANVWEPGAAGTESLWAESE